MLGALEKSTPYSNWNAWSKLRYVVPDVGIDTASRIRACDVVIDGTDGPYRPEVSEVSGRTVH